MAWIFMLTLAILSALSTIKNNGPSEPHKRKIGKISLNKNTIFLKYSQVV